ELKALHKAIKKVEEDNERFSFNTVVSTLMVCVNELTDLGCAKRAILEPLAILAAPHAPHIAEELWALMGHEDSITQASWPVLNAGYLVEDSITYPVSFNGKMRFKIEQPVDATKEAIEAAVLAHEAAQKWLDGKAPKRVIVVPKKIVNVVV
ncbi:MAG: class I tRNA ligase family protein, partial [Bacteroidota bacterium]